MSPYIAETTISVFFLDKFCTEAKCISNESYLNGLYKAIAKFNSKLQQRFLQQKFEKNIVSHLNNIQNYFGFRLDFICIYLESAKIYCYQS